MLGRFEEARNQRDWHKLAIPTLETGGLLLPTSFRLGTSTQDAMVLRELAKAEVSLAIAPLPLGADALGYMQQLDANSIDDFTFIKDKSPRRFGLGTHKYRGSEVSLWHSFDQLARAPDFARVCTERMNYLLPDKVGREAFAADMGRGLQSLYEALGAPMIVSLSGSTGWMPAPHRLQPHHDFGQHSLRVFFNLQGAGTLVIAPESLPLAQQRMLQRGMIQNGETFTAAYPSFNALAQQQVPLYSLPSATVAIWRVGDAQNRPHNSYSCLPHAFPPHQCGARLTAYATYSYEQVQQHTGLCWRPD